MARKSEVSEAAIGEALGVAMAVSAGKVRAQTRDALKGMLEPLSMNQSAGG